MDTARIAELLDPFLSRLAAAPFSTARPFDPWQTGAAPPTSRHSEPAKAGEEPAVLSPALLQHISTYIDLLLRWNARINLTAIRDPEQIVTRHFGESFFAAQQLLPVPARVGTAALGCPAERSAAALTAADLGSGAGFPGLPLKLWAPHISLTLIESSHKKATFLREVTRTLTLTDVDIQTARAEQLANVTFDLVTLRAVEHFAAILPVAARLVAPAGRLSLLIGAAQLGQARASLPHLSWSEALSVPLSRSRILAIAKRPQV